MLTYQEHAEAHKEAILKKSIAYHKALLDLALLLDDPLFMINDDLSGPIGPRENLIAEFCTICTHAEISLPAPEQSLYKAIVQDCAGKEPSAEIQRFIDVATKNLTPKRSKKRHGRQQQDQRDEHSNTRALLTVLALFNGAYSIPPRALQAAINVELMKKGLPPVCDDYTQNTWSPPTGHELIDPEMTVLVVDDEFNSIANTVIRLAGWQGLRIEFCHHVSRWSRWTKPDEATILARIKEAADVILAHNPAIVLMDEGLGDVSGADLVAPILELAPDTKIIPSTGGTGSEFAKIGLRRNLNKGKDLYPLRSAIRRLNHDRLPS